MQAPACLHPTTYKIGAVYVRVVTVDPVEEQHARRIAMLFYRSRRFTQKDKGQTFTTVTTFTRETAALLGP